MTGFSMRFLKRCKEVTGLLLLLTWASMSAHAATGIEIKKAELVENVEAYQLNADFSLNVSPEVEEAKPTLKDAKTLKFYLSV